ncbi:MAG: glycosyltransferase family 4 protein [Lachnospiraceae bacterium]|nr:glycosyltransferase family 4 protein [Lachnospiraceae bacterium]
MKILFISHYDNMYGANRALLSLMLGLKAAGEHEPLAVIPAEGEFTRRLKEEGIEYHICPVTQWQAIYRGPLSFALKRAKRRRRIEKELETLYALFKDAGIGLIHSNSSVVGTGAMLAERLGCPHVWHIREFSEEHYGMKYFYPLRRVRSLYEKAECLVTISEALRENYEKRYPAAHVIRIYDGAEEQPLPERTAGEERHLRCLYVAYLFPKKHQLELLEAFEELDRKEYSLILAGGGDASYEKKLRAYIEKQGLTNVELCGFTDRIPELLSRSDVGIMASEYEGFGLVTVEYMLAGLPVVGFDSGATPELVRQDLNGMIYKDREGLKEALRKLKSDPGLAHKLGEAGRKRAKECFLSGRNTAEMIKLYHTLEEGIAKKLSHG